MSAEIIVRVCNMECSRYFYREVLGLGEPVADSTFVAVFRLAPGTRLVLEFCSSPYLEHASAPVLWGWEPADYAATVARLQKAGACVGDETEFCGRVCRSCRDPEGNEFRLIAPVR